MKKFVFVILSLIFSTQVQAQQYALSPNDVVEPKLIITNPGGGGYNLDQRVYELERANQALVESVRETSKRYSALNQKLFQLERRIDQLGNGNGGGYGYRDNYRCAIHTGRYTVTNTGRSEEEARQKVRDECRRELRQPICESYIGCERL